MRWNASRVRSLRPAGEKEQVEKIKKSQEKKQQKLASKGVAKLQRKKSIRVRKGVTVKVR
jgi:hypothetical protein